MKKGTPGNSLSVALLVTVFGLATLTDARTENSAPEEGQALISERSRESPRVEVDVERPDLIGQVRANDGAPIGSATVFISTAAPRVGTSSFCPSCYVDCRKSAKTDAEGNFKIESLDPQLTFRILVAATGYQPKFVAKVDPASGSLSVALDTLNRGDITPDRSVRGRVVDAKGEPVIGAAVYAHGIRQSGGRGQWGSLPGVDPLAITDEDGTFLITSREPFESMDVKVEARTFANKTFTGLASGNQAHELALIEGAAVSGRVLSGGKPLPHVSVGIVSVDRSENFTGYFEIGTDGNGRFEFVNLPPETDYFVYGIMDSIKPFGAIPTVLTRSAADGGTTDAGDLVVGPSHRLAGRVVLADGSVVPPKTRLLVSRSDAWDSTHVELDEEGRFDVTGIPAESLSLSVRMPGYRVSAQNPSLDPLNPYMLVGRLDRDITNLVFLLEKGKNLTPIYSSHVPESERPQNLPLRGAEAPED